jgi:hypothetical protein
MDRSAALAELFRLLDDHMNADGRPPADWSRLSVALPSHADLAAAIEQVGIYERKALPADRLAGLILAEPAGRVAGHDWAAMPQPQDEGKGVVAMVRGWLG